MCGFDMEEIKKPAWMDNPVYRHISLKYFSGEEMTGENGYINLFGLERYERTNIAGIFSINFT